MKECSILCMDVYISQASSDIYSIANYFRIIMGSNHTSLVLLLELTGVKK